MGARNYRIISCLLGVLALLVLPTCAKVKRVAATSGAAVQHTTAKVGDGADKVGDTLRSGVDKTAAKIERVGEKVDHAVKALGNKLDN